MGENAQFMSDLANDTARINQVLSDLDLIYSGAATANYVEGVVQDWTNEPYVRGSYSYPAPGTFPGGTSMREELAAPVGTTLYFAGEATHNGAPATVPGAMQSGDRASGEVRQRRRRAARCRRSDGGLLRVGHRWRSAGDGGRFHRLVQPDADRLELGLRRLLVVDQAAPDYIGTTSRGPTP